MGAETIKETAITIDYDCGECRVDTSVRGVASKLVRCGFIEVTKANSAPYRRFVGTEKQVTFRKTGSRVKVASKGVKIGAKTLRIDGKKGVGK